MAHSKIVKHCHIPVSLLVSPHINFFWREGAGGVFLKVDIDSRTSNLAY